MAICYLPEWGSLGIKSQLHTLEEGIFPAPLLILSLQAGTAGAGQKMTGFLPPSLGRAHSIFGNRSCKFGILPSAGPHISPLQAHHTIDHHWCHCKVEEHLARPHSGAARRARG